MEQFELSTLKFVTLCAVNKLEYQVKETRFRENRPRHALTCKIQGRTVYGCNGKEFVSDRDHILLLPKGSDYSLSYEELGECFLVEFDTAEPLPVHEIRSYSPSNTLEIQAVFHRLERLWSVKKPAYYNRCMSGLYEILSRLEEASHVSYQFSSKYSLIASSVEYMETNYHNSELNMDLLASISGISTVYFRRIFSEIYKMPPAKYLQDLRIQKAKELLISDYPSVCAVASAVGFHDIYHFCKIFKKLTGFTPTEFAKSASLQS